MFKVSVYLNELEKFKPEQQSVNYAAIEHAEDRIVAPLDANWNDIVS
jgi:mannose-1-phosphate guanylyltransferase